MREYCCYATYPSINPSIATRSGSEVSLVFRLYSANQIPQIKIPLHLDKCTVGSSSVQRLKPCTIFGQFTYVRCLFLKNIINSLFV